MTKTIGITGGIGSGKSIVGKILATMGYPVFYSDAEAKRLMSEDAELINSIKNIIGNEAYIDGQLNRTFLAEKIFTQPKLKEKINALVHPKVRDAFSSFVKNHPHQLVFNEAAILFETGAYKNFDATLLVVADKETRIARVMKRDQVTREQVIARMSNQWEDEKKIPLADYVITNNNDELVVSQVVDLLDQLKKN